MARLPPRVRPIGASSRYGHFNSYGNSTWYGGAYFEKDINQVCQVLQVALYFILLGRVTCCECAENIGQTKK